MYQGKVAVHWDKWKSLWRVYEGAPYRLTKTVLLKQAYFFVQPEGREKCREAAKVGQSEFEARFPHAFAFGALASGVPEGIWRPINYNPFKTDYFVFTITGVPVVEIPYVRFLENGRGEAWLPKAILFL